MFVIVVVFVVVVVVKGCPLVTRLCRHDGLLDYYKMLSFPFLFLCFFFPLCFVTTGSKESR